MKYKRNIKFYKELYKSKNNREITEDEFDSFASFIDMMIEEDEKREKNSDVFGYRHAKNIGAELSVKPTEISERKLKLKHGFITRNYLFPKNFTDKYEFTDQIYVDKNKDKFVELFKETMSINHISIFNDVEDINEMRHILNGMTSRYMINDIRFWVDNRLRKETGAFRRSFKFCEKYELGFVPSTETKNKISKALRLQKKK